MQAIVYDSTPNAGKRNRPYQIENWRLQLLPIREMIKSIHLSHFAGSLMFSIMRLLQKLRDEMKKWCLNNKRTWGDQLEGGEFEVGYTIFKHKGCQ